MLRDSNGTSGTGARGTGGTGGTGVGKVMPQQQQRLRGDL